MSENIKITVIIPVYNVEAYIRRCLDSVVNQSFFNIEIICIDDKSTDNSLNIIKEYCQRDNRIKCIENKINRGLSYTRNVGIKASIGEYVFFLDSDDTISNDALEKLYKIVSIKNFQMVFFDFINCYVSEHLKSHLNYKNKNRTSLEGEWTGPELFIKMVENCDMQPQAWLKLYNREFLLCNGLFFHEGIMHEDIPYAVKAMFMADKVYFTGDKLYEWWHREDSITTAKTSIAHIEGRIKGIVEIIEFMDCIELSERERLAVEKYVLSIMNAAKEKIKELDNKDLLFADDIKHRLFLDMLLENKKEIKISGKQKKHIIDSEQIFVYGAGKIAQLFMQEIMSWNIQICGVIVTEIQNQLYFYGHKIEEAGCVADNMKNNMVVVAVSKQFHKTIGDNLKKLGFSNIEYL